VQDRSEYSSARSASTSSGPRSCARRGLGRCCRGASQSHRSLGCCRSTGTAAPAWSRRRAAGRCHTAAVRAAAQPGSRTALLDLALLRSSICVRKMSISRPTPRARALPSVSFQVLRRPFRHSFVACSPGVSVAKDSVLPVRADGRGWQGRSGCQGAYLGERHPGGPRKKTPANREGISQGTTFNLRL